MGAYRVIDRIVDQSDFQYSSLLPDGASDGHVVTLDWTGLGYEFKAAAPTGETGITISSPSWISISTTGTASPANPFSSVVEGVPTWDNDSFDSIQSVLDWFSGVSFAGQGFLNIRIYPGDYACNPIILSNPDLQYTRWYADESDMGTLPDWYTDISNTAAKIAEFDGFAVKILFDLPVGGYAFTISSGTDGGRWENLLLKNSALGSISGTAGFYSSSEKFSRITIRQLGFQNFERSIDVFKTDLSITDSWAGCFFLVRNSTGSIRQLFTLADQSISNSSFDVIYLIGFNCLATLTNVISSDVEVSSSIQFRLDIQGSSNISYLYLAGQDISWITQAGNVQISQADISINNPTISPPYIDLTSGFYVISSLQISAATLGAFVLIKKAATLNLESGFTFSGADTTELVAESGARAFIEGTYTGTLNPTAGTPGATGEVIYEL